MPSAPGRVNLFRNVQEQLTKFFDASTSLLDTAGRRAAHLRFACLSVFVADVY